jgi:hypothetical protein
MGIKKYTKNRHCIYLFFFVAYCLSVGCEPSEKHSVFCLYEANAGPPGYPQFVLKSIDGDTLHLQSNQLKAEFSTPQLDSAFYKQISECVICFNCFFEGEIYYSNWKGYYIMNVESFEVKLRNNCCDE